MHDGHYGGPFDADREPDDGGDLDAPAYYRRPSRFGFLERLLPENRFATIMVVGTVLIIFIVLLINR